MFFCFMNSDLFSSWTLLEDYFPQKQYVLTKTLAAAGVLIILEQCSDLQKMLLAYSVTFDGIYGYHKGKKRSQVPFPACLVLQVRRLWPQDLSDEELVDAGHTNSQGPSRTREE